MKVLKCSLVCIKGQYGVHGCLLQSPLKSGLPSELLYADDLVRMALTMEQLGRHVGEWRSSLLDKGLKENAGKSNVIVGSSSVKMIRNSGKWPCVLCGKGVQAQYVKCGFTCGDLSLVADGFRCKRCDGTIQTIQEADLAEDLMVDGETYWMCKELLLSGRHS